MTTAKDLRRLADVAQLILDHRLGRLRTLAAELDRSRMHLASINANGRPNNELEPMTAERVGIVYDRWADARRAELNLVIARQTAGWIEARNDAQDAFGRVQALRGLATRLRDKR